MSEPRSPILSHPLNLILVASAAVSALWTGDVRPLVVGAVAELVWLVSGPFLERRQRRAARRIEVDDAEQDRVRALSEPLRRRFLELDVLRSDIQRLAGANPSLESVGIERELRKVDELVKGWLRLAVSVSHMTAILEGEDLTAVERQLAGGQASGTLSESARAALESRLREGHAARSALEASEAELVEVEAVLATVRDRVMSVSSPASLSQPLDALLGGLSAAERAIRDLEALEMPRSGSAGPARAVSRGALAREQSGS